MPGTACRAPSAASFRRRRSTGSRSDGLRYTNFHSTALCSPTRAALITGRNHHSVGYGVIAEQATGYPGYDSIITRDKATIGRILKDNGYHTAWFGKNHNTPEYQASQAGPFDQWPTGMGFEYFYGFMGGDTNQWEPGNLVRNTTPIYPYVGKPGWNLMTAMADEAIDYMNRINALSPDQPFLIKFAPGATHAPHHPTPEWVKKISDMHLFDRGLEQAARHDLREPEEARRHSARCQADAVAEGPAQGTGTSSPPTRRSCSSARSTCSPPSSPTPTTRSVASSRRSRTSASSTTR